MKLKYLALLTCSALFLTSCNKSESPNTSGSSKSQSETAPTLKTVASAEKTSFQEVTSHLDAGGDLFVYVSTEQWFNGLSKKIGENLKALQAIPSMKTEDQQKLDRGLTLITNLIWSSGVEDVSGVGISSIATEKDFHRSKSILHHYKGKGSGDLWKLFGQKPHPMAGLSMLPTNTAFAAFSDLDLNSLWTLIQKAADQAAVPQATESLQKLKDAVEQGTGLTLDQFMHSIGGEFGIVLTLDESRKVSIPVSADNPLEIPEPALMFVMKVNDDAIFNLIDKQLKKAGQQIFSTDKPNLKMRTLALPLPLPIQLGPTVALSDGYLFLATTDLIVQSALAVKAGEKPGLKSTPEFQRLSKDTPTEANHFAFLSQRFGKTLNRIQEQALPFATNAAPAQADFLKTWLTTDKTSTFYAVGANTDEGWYHIALGTQHPAKLLMASAVVPAILAARLAVPAASKSQHASTCKSNLREIQSAKKVWALESKKKDSDIPTRAELIPYLHNSQFPSCPDGGVYSMNSVAENPECNQPGHSLDD